MHHSFLDKYSNLESPVHRLHPLVKLGVYGIFIVAVLTGSIHTPLPLVLLGFFLVVVAAAGRLPAGFLLRKLLLLAPLVVTMLILLPFFKGEDIIVAGPRYLPLNVTREGIALLLSITFKAALVLMASIVLISTTPFSELLYGLQMLKIPHVTITVLAFMYRYFFLLLDEIERMDTARRARLFKRQRFKAYLTTLYYVVRAVFIRSFERSERIYQAMCARGFSGQVFVLRAPKFRTHDVMVLACATLIIAAVKFLA